MHTMHIICQPCTHPEEEPTTPVPVSHLSVLGVCEYSSCECAPHPTRHVDWRRVYNVIYLQPSQQLSGIRGYRVRKRS